MSILTRFAQARQKFEKVQEQHKTKKIQRYKKEEEVLKEQVKVENLKTKVSTLKATQKKNKTFGFKGVGNRISSQTKSDTPYWLKEKPKKPSWL